MHAARVLGVGRQELAGRGFSSRQVLERALGLREQVQLHRIRRVGAGRNRRLQQIASLLTLPAVDQSRGTTSGQSGRARVQLLRSPVCICRLLPALLLFIQLSDTQLAAVIAWVLPDHLFNRLRGIHEPIGSFLRC